MGIFPLLEKRVCSDNVFLLLFLFPLALRGNTIHLLFYIHNCHIFEVLIAAYCWLDSSGVLNTLIDSMVTDSNTMYILFLLSYLVRLTSL